jgi:hypothetical protein
MQTNVFTNDADNNSRTNDRGSLLSCPAPAPEEYFVKDLFATV